MANQVDFKILPSDQFNVYSPQTRSDKIITYFTLLSKLRGDILAVGQEDDPNDIVSAYYSNVGGTQTLHLVKADGSEVTASYSTATSSENQNASTGILVGGELTASIGGTTFSISAGVGQIVSQTATPSGVSTIITPISWDAFTSITPTNLTTQPFTYIYIDSSGALQQQATPFNDAQYKNSIIIGHLCHIDLATINLVTSDQNVAYGTPTRLLELIQTFGPIKKEGLTLSANGSNLQVNRSAGEGFIIGSNYQTDQFDPDKIVISAKTPSLLCRIYRDGSGGYVFDNNSGSYYNNIDPTKYDNGSGTLQTVNNNQWTIQRLYTFPSAPDDIICYYGTQIYNSQGDAIDNIPYEPFSEAPITLLNSIFLGYVVVRGGATNLSSLGDATFIQAGLFRGLGSGGGSTTNLKLEDLSDVVITSPQNQDFLFYNSTSQEWQNVAVGTFKTIAVAGQSDVVADAYNDTLTLVAGTNVTITTDASTDSITINSTDQFVGTVTSVDMSVPTGFAISGNPITTSGTLALAFATGYSLPTDATQANWTAAYNDKINSASFDTSTGVITLTQQDAGTITVDIDGRFILLSEKGAANGVATLDAGGKLPVSQLPSSVFEYKGTWNAATNTPTLANGTGDPGDVYRCTVAGTVDFGAGAISFEIGDLVIYDGTEWQKSDSTDAVTSVNGYTGTVVLTTSDISEGTNLYFTTARARQSLSAGTAISYDNSTGVITNSAPDQIVAITAGTGTSVAGTYPNFTISATGTGGTVTSVDITAGPKILSSGGPITTSGSITVSHEGATPSDLVTMTEFINYVVANGGAVEAVGPVGEVLAPLTGYTVQPSTSNSGGTVLQNIAVDAYGHVNGVGSITLDTDDIAEGSTNLYFTNARAQAAINAFSTIAVSGQSNVVADAYNDTLTFATSGSGFTITTDASTDTITFTNTLPDQTVVLTAGSGIGVAGTYPNFTIANTSPSSGGTVTSVNLTAGDRIDVSGGPITTSGSITVTHGVADGADFITTEEFRDRVIADGGIFEALGEVAIAIGSLEDAASPTSTDYSGGTVLQNLAIDEFGHVLGVGAITLDTDDIAEGSTNLYYTDARSRAALSAGTGISYDSATGVITNSDPDQTVSLTASTGITVAGAYPSFTIENTDRGSAQNIFKNFAVTGSSTVVADNNDDTVTFTGGTGITLAGNASSDTITITNSAPDQTVVLTAGTGISTSGTYPNFTITNTAPDQVVSLTGAGTTSISGSYPSFTITSNDQFTGTVTSVDLTAGAKIGVSGGPITTSGSITVEHLATEPADLPTMTSFIAYVQANGGVVEAVGPVGQVLATLTGATVATSTSNTGGTVLQNIAIDDYGHVFGVSSVTLDTDDIVEGSTNLYYTDARSRAALSAGTGISYDNSTGVITNSAPDQTVVLTGTGTTTITGTYPSFTINSDDQYDGTVTSINLTAGDRIEVSGGPITSSGSITVTHGVVDGADFITAEAFRDRVVADGGTFEALGEVAIAIGSLDDAASPTSTDYSDGVVLQNIAVDEFGHVLGVGATDLDERYAQVAFKNVAVSGQNTIVADAIEDTINIAAGYGVSITTDDTTDTVTIGAQFIPYPVYAASMYRNAVTLPFGVTGTWTVVNIESTNIQLAAPVDSDGVYSENLATITISIQNQIESAAFICVGIRLYNQTQSAIITDSTRTWTGYLDIIDNDSSSTIFTYHIPIEEYVVAGDTIRVQMIDLNGLDPRVNFASFSLLATSGPV